MYTHSYVAEFMGCSNKTGILQFILYVQCHIFFTYANIGASVLQSEQWLHLASSDPDMALSAYNSTDHIYPIQQQMTD